MNWASALEALWAVWPAAKEKFQPAAYLVRADEPEFGCEARSETDPVFGRLLVQTQAGQKTIAIEESRLMQSGFYDKMWVGWWEEQPVLLTAKEKSSARAEDVEWLVQEIQK